MIVLSTLTACATAPRPTSASLHIAKNPRAILEGRVTDGEGRAAAGIGVRGIPRGEDIPWSAPALTDCDGRFRLSVAAPAAYAFILSWKDTAVVTPAPDDPALVTVPVEPGQIVRDVALVFDAAAWRKAAGTGPADTPSCP